MPVAAAQPSPASGSSLFNGYPCVMEETDIFLDNFQALLESSILNAVMDARRRLQASAQVQDGWKDIASSLDVVFDGVDFVYTVSGTSDTIAAATKLEYGDAETPPTGFLRKAAQADGARIGLLVAQRLSAMVPSA